MNSKHAIPSGNDSPKPTSQEIEKWSKADFLHRAQELCRRLANWQIDDNGPVWTPRGVEFLRVVERSFRHRVLAGPHDKSEHPTAAITLIPIPSAKRSHRIRTSTAKT